MNPHSCGPASRTPASFAACATRQDPAEDPHTGRSVRPLSPAASPPDAGVPDLADPHLAINFVSPTYRPPETLVPKPRLSPTLKDDIWIGHRLQRPGYLRYIEWQLERRRQVEADKREFTLPPLLVTLENMQIFMAHIQSGKQFDGPLTPEESQALAGLAETNAILVQARAPYKRTVRQALALTTLCEIITGRQVFASLKKQEPALFRELRIDSSWIDLHPGDVTSLFLSDKAPAPLDAHQKDLADRLDASITRFLDSTLNDPAFLVWPSFQTLDLAHLCQLSHLPVYPVGLMTHYARNAGGSMASPLQFALHDISHMQCLQQAMTDHNPTASPAQALFYQPDWRLAWRRLLLDRLPAPLADLGLTPALTLLLFELFHQRMPNEAAWRVGAGNRAFFLFCLEVLAQARRNKRASWSRLYQNITDTQAAMAALWTVRLWQCGQVEGPRLTEDQLQECVRLFTSVDLPALQEHLDFLGRHRAALRQLFFKNFCWAHFGGEGFSALFKSLFFKGMDELVLFHQFHRRHGLCHLDHTDLAYFAASSLPDMRQMMAGATHAPVPPARFSPPPLPAAQAADSIGQEVMP